tara:strand:+ start:217 stop:828 length:612 start_codon:yes stop_codon:yes gene_type:complete
MSEDKEKDDEVKIFTNQKKNLIYFNAPIENEYILQLIEHLYEMEQNELERVNEFIFEMKKKTGTEFKQTDYIKPIILEINSNGGLIYEAFAVVDTIKNLSVPVHTICKGYTASAATLITLAGSRRFMTKNSYFLIHEITDEITGNYTFMKHNFENSKILMEHIIDYYVKNSNLNYDKVKEHINTEISWNAEETLQFGFVDKII